ncbi:MAG: carboxylating nicotinate-nucleotide diphosphorylase [Rhodothermales bacterium]
MAVPLMPDLPDYLSLIDLDALIVRALAEDVGAGDVTTLATIPEATQASAQFLVKETGTIAGCLVAERVFAQVDPEVTVTWTVQEGAAVDAGTVIGRVEGAARSLLIGERLALNLMQRMSGIATAARHMVETAKPHTPHILDTRKTVPGLRALDKWAVKLGGGTNHRIGLYDRILIKDNHIAARGSIAEAIHAANAYRQQYAPEVLIEIEARTLEEVDEVIATGGVEIVLLDNMVQLHDNGFVDTSMLREAVQRIDGRLQTEASGNVTLGTVAAIAATGVDAISSGALTHSVRALDISLKIVLH